MKLNYVNDVVTTFGAEDTEDYTIAASAKMYHILSNGLYSNKILAVVREITCNAYDSHIVAGKKDVPVEVHLPTNFEPWFSVKDQGIGMDYETAKVLYTTYGRSTKTDSNDVVGALGLGSKSPFAYTSSFTVTAIKNGQKNVFSAYMRENGKPGISHMASTETDEPNGVTVNIPVKLNDIMEFRDTASSCFYWFDTTPKTNITLSIRSPFGTTEKFREVASGATGCITTNRYMTVQWFARQGVVGYPIDISVIKDKIDPRVQNLAGRMHLIVDFDIGSLDIAPSREALSYDKNTVRVIVDRMNAVLTEALTNIKDMFGKEDHFYDACANYIANGDFASMVSSTDLVHAKTGRGLVNRLFVPSDFNGVKFVSTARISYTYSNRSHGEKFFYSKEHSTFSFLLPNECVPVVYVVGNLVTISQNQVKRRIENHMRTHMGTVINGRTFGSRGSIGYVYTVEGNADAAVDLIRTAIGLEDFSPFIVNVHDLPAVKAVRAKGVVSASDYAYRNREYDNFVKGTDIEGVLDSHTHVIKAHSTEATLAAELILDSYVVAAATKIFEFSPAVVKEYKTRPLDVDAEAFVTVDDYLMELYENAAKYVEDNYEEGVNSVNYRNSNICRTWLHEVRTFTSCMSIVMDQHNIVVPKSYVEIEELYNKMTFRSESIRGKVYELCNFIDYMNRKDAEKFVKPTFSTIIPETQYKTVQEFLDKNGLSGYTFPDVEKIKLMNVGRVKTKSDCEFIMKII